MLRSGFPQSCRQPGHPLVFLKEMHRPQNCSVAHLAAQAGQPRVKFRRIYLPQHPAAKLRCHRSHLPRDGRVILSQVGMAPTGIHHIHRHTPAGKVAGQALHNRGLRAKKINGNRAAHRRRGLVHQAAGLTKVLIFGILAYARQCHRRNGPIIIQGILNLPQQQLKSRRRGQPGTGGNNGIGHTSKAAGRIPLLPQPGKDTSYHGGGMAPLLFVMGQVAPVQRGQRMALAAYLHRPLLLRRYDGQLVQRNSSSQHPAVLVVGVVAAQLGAARCRKDAHLFPFPIQPGKLLQQAQTALPLRQRVIAHIQPAQCLIAGAALQGFFPLGRSWHRSFLRQFRVKRISTGLWSE